MKNTDNDSNKRGRCSRSHALAGSQPIYPQPANSSDASWAGAQVGGMTLREHYAGLAMAAYIQADTAEKYTDEVIANLSLKASDALCSILSENAK